MKHLHERMDDLFSNGTPWKHRTLRTLFDPASAEWTWTTMEEKVSILRKMIEAGESLLRIKIEYQDFYSHRSDIANDFDQGLIEIMEIMLKGKN